MTIQDFAHGSSAPTPAQGNRNIVVVGASAGGVDALQRLMRDLPGELPAAVLVVLHMGPSSRLARLLDRAGPLPAREAKNGDIIQNGRVYVAAPGVHLLVHDGHLLLRRGPRENLARPAIDALFRSAASSYGGRVIGVVLTGSLNDGTAGLRAIKRCGGIAVIQDPADAAVPDMPRNAQARVDVDYCLPLADIGGLLSRLAAEPAGPTPPIPRDIRLETAIAAQERSGMATEEELGTPSPFTCPECHGALWEIVDGDLHRYRCHVGHAFSPEVMMAAQDAEVERMLWSLLRAHQARAALARRMASAESSRNRSLASHLKQRAAEYDEDADLMRQLLCQIPAAEVDPDRENEGDGR